MYVILLNKTTVSMNRICQAEEKKRKLRMSAYKYNERRDDRFGYFVEGLI